MQPFDIFRVGTHTDAHGRTLTFSASDLEAMAAAYDPALHEAPIVIGHPAHDMPAYGWVEKLVYDPPGRLQAVPHQVDVSFAELVKEGRFKKVSASFYLPSSPSNPKPGVYYLRHVGFLGAQPPAVKGLRQVQFDESAEVVTLEYEEPAVIASASSDLVATSRTSQDLARREAELAQREAELARREAELRRRAIVEFVDRLVVEGRVLPKDREALITFLGAIPEQTLAFAEGEMGMMDWVMRWLATLPPVVAYGEHAAPQVEPAPSRFRRPGDGGVIDPERLRLHQQALAYQEAHPGCSYAEAVIAVSGGM